MHSTQSRCHHYLQSGLRRRPAQGAYAQRTIWALAISLAISTSASGAENKLHTLGINIDEAIAALQQSGSALTPQPCTSEHVLCRWSLASGVEITATTAGQMPSLPTDDKRVYQLEAVWNTGRAPKGLKDYTSACSHIIDLATRGKTAVDTKALTAKATLTRRTDQLTSEFEHDLGDRKIYGARNQVTERRNSPALLQCGVVGVTSK